MIAALPATVVATLVQRQVNHNLQFAQAAGRVSHMLCDSRGANHFACRGILRVNGRNYHVLWGDVLFTPSGHYVIPKPQLI